MLLHPQIANAGIYWFSGHIASSFWLYYNHKLPTGDAQETADARVDVPCAVGLGRHEIDWVR
jgi:hypothetical protein